MAEEGRDGRGAHFPGRTPIEAYGNGGFRFAGMSHRGSILILPDGVHDWPPADAAALVPEDFATVFKARELIGIFLLGTGETQVWPSPAVAAAFHAAGIEPNPMATGAAVRTYNVLQAEGRPVAAGLIAVDRAR